MSTTISLSGKLDGTSIESAVSISESSRTATTVNVGLNFVTSLVTSLGYIYAGEEIVAELSFYNSSQSVATQKKQITIKSKYESWTTTTEHKKSSSVSIKAPSSATKLYVKYTLKILPSEDYLEEASSLLIAKGIAVPNAPTALSLSCLGDDKYFLSNKTITFSWTAPQINPKDYQIHRKVLRENQAYDDSSWQELGVTTNVYITDVITDETIEKVYYAVRSRNDESSAFCSSWVYYIVDDEQTPLIKARKIKVRTAGEYKDARIWLKRGQTWEPSSFIWVKDGGTWKK